MNALKIGLAILFFVCLADMPYGYCQFTRFAGLIGFLILARNAHDNEQQTEMIFYGALALLFQPFFKITLGRQVWNVLDITVGLLLVISIWVKSKKQN